jgi:GAF domain-containing protein
MPAVQSLAAEIARSDGVLGAATGDGRVVDVFGEESAVARARAHHLAAGYDWSEQRRGTNAIGTALVDGSALVIGSEHWCGDLAGWSGAGVAVLDPHLPRPCAALALFVYNRPIPEAAITRLRSCAHELGLGLREQRIEILTELFAKFRQQQSRFAGPLAIIDCRGEILASSDATNADFGWPSKRLTPAARGGALRLVAGTGDDHAVTVQPIRQDDQLIGALIAAQPEGPAATATGYDRVAVSRLAGMHGGHILLMAPSEIRLAQAEDKIVWLFTDRGRLRALDRTLSQVATKLAPHGFLRVHRHCVVNLHRVREIAPTFRGGIVLIVDGPDRETVPVSRRRLVEVRRALGI